jgi:hypothetical protein
MSPDDMGIPPGDGMGIDDEEEAGEPTVSDEESF